MNNKPFRGFPAKGSYTSLPNLFFTALLPQIGDLAELKLLLHIFWLLSQKRSHPKFVTCEELMADRILMEGIAEGSNTPNDVLCNALESAVKRGVLLHLKLDNEGEQQDLYFINAESNRKAIARLKSGESSLADISNHAESHIKQEKPNIFTMYEQNIGLLTPMIAEELKAAEKLYPHSWIEDAFKEAVSLKKLNWRYIARILERWSSEGKDSGEFRRDSKKEKDPDRYVKGKYGHLVRR
ncbi:DnaD domain-containing protein [Chloroflexota bacterium]